MRPTVTLVKLSRPKLAIGEARVLVVVPVLGEARLVRARVDRRTCVAETANELPLAGGRMAKRQLQLYAEREGLDWCRSWSKTSDDVKALKVARALAGQTVLDT